MKLMNLMNLMKDIDFSNYSEKQEDLLGSTMKLLTANSQRLIREYRADELRVGKVPLHEIFLLRWTPSLLRILIEFEQSDEGTEKRKQEGLIPLSDDLEIIIEPNPLIEN